MIFDLKGHIRSNKALYFYLLSSNNSSVKPTLPLMLPLNCICALCDCASQHNSHLKGEGRFPLLLFRCRNDVQSFNQIITLTYVLMDNFCSLFIRAQGHLARDNFQIKFYKPVSWSPGVGFFPIAAINLLSLKRIRYWDFQNNL